MLPLLLNSTQRRRYIHKVLTMQRANIIAYWPLSESSGTQITDLSGNDRHGTYTGVDLGQTGIGDGRTAPLWDGNDYGNMYSTSLRDVFNGQEGAFACWCKMSGVGVWSDGIARRVVNIDADASNSLRIRRNTSNGTLTWDYVAAGSAGVGVSLGALSTTDWFHVALTWSKAADQVKAYYNGVQTGSTQTGIGTWAGLPVSTTTVLGARTTAPLLPWSGWLAHAAIWSTPLAAADIATLAVVP